MTIGLIILGIVMLIGGGTALVNGASQIAARLGVSPMVVGLTIVAFGTSMPELVVNMISAIQGVTELAFGNVLGSNIANLALVLGAAALIRPIDIHSQLVQRELPLLMLATAILTVLALDAFFGGGEPSIGRADAVILLLVFTIFLYVTILDFLREPAPDAIFAEISANPLLQAETTGRFGFFLILVGIALLYFGGDLTVRHSVALAESLAVSPAIIGLFIVALGTSMPELVTSIIAAARKESDLALGNIVGSNLFNTLAVLPAAALLNPVSIPAGGVGDIIVSFVLALALIPVFVLGRARLGRVVGAAFLLAYVAWVVLRIF